MPSSSGGGVLRRNALANIAGRLVTAALWVAVTPLALDHLGVQGFAVWSLFFALSGSAAVLDLGVANSAARYVAVGLGRADHGFVRLAARRSVVFGVGLGLLWGTVCVIGRGFFPAVFNIDQALRADVQVGLLYVALSMALFAPAQALQGVLMGFQRLDLSNLSLVAGVIVHVTILVLVLLAGWGLVGATMASAVAQAVALVVAWLSVRSQFGEFSREGPRESLSWRTYMSFGASVQATNAFVVAHAQLPKFMLAALGQLAWVTAFELGVRVAMTIWAIPTMVQGAVIPAAAEASAMHGVSGLRHIYGWACRWIFAAAAWLLGGLWLCAPAAFMLWLGPGQDASAEVARLLAVAFGATILVGPAMSIARGSGRPMLETLMVGTALVVHVAAGYVLIPRLGPTGAVAAMGLSYLASAVWLLRAFHAWIEISSRSWILHRVLPRYGPAVIAAGSVWWATSSLTFGSRLAAVGMLALQGMAYTAIYVGLTWRTGDPGAIFDRIRNRVSKLRPPDVLGESS